LSPRPLFSSPPARGRSRQSIASLASTKSRWKKFVDATNRLSRDVRAASLRAGHAEITCATANAIVNGTTESTTNAAAAQPLAAP